MKSWLIIVAAAAGVALAGSPAAADLITIGAAKDNTLYEDPDGLLSNGVGDHFFTGRSLKGRIRRGLIAFDVASAVPAGATIDSVTLTLHMSKTIGPVTAVGLHPVLKDWGEGDSHAPGEEGAGAASAPGDATWRHTSYDGSFWDNPGGDFSAAASASVMVGGVDFYTWGATDAMVDDVQSWLDDPSQSFGWVLIGNEASIVTAKRFDTHENPDLSMRPELSIEYTAVPAPGAGLVVLGGLLAGTRRRR